MHCPYVLPTPSLFHNITLTVICRDKVWSRAVPEAKTSSKPHSVHANQLRRPSHIPARDQFLQDLSTDQLPALVERHTSHDLPHSRPDSNRFCLRSSPGMCPDTCFGLSACAQVMGTQNTRILYPQRPVLYCLRHHNHRLRCACYPHSNSHPAAAHGQQEQEAWSYCHFPTWFLHHTLLSVSIYADRPHPEWRWQFDHAYCMGCH